ncbi:inositol monophosphatase [Flavimaricola sp.]|nr:inositol monophosphatase family protein [Flavimaricola sp.]MDA9019954.1 inositol monophosphatase [Flavimaricola sp.]
MTDPIDARFELAKTIAAKGAESALAYFNARDTLVIEDKMNPQDMVSQADKEVELLLRAAIAAAFPDDAILGEEGGATVGNSGFIWVLDPIDGTSPFLAGLPHWGVVIAILQGDETVAGVIAQPMAGETFTARLGAGAWVNDTPMQVGHDLTLNTCNVGMGISHRSPIGPFIKAIEDVLTAGGMFYRNGSGAVMLASVAVGRLGGYYEPHMNPWDCLAGLLMVREAGGQTLPFPVGAQGGTVLAAAPRVFLPLHSICL